MKMIKINLKFKKNKIGMTVEMVIEKDRIYVSVLINAFCS